MSSLATKHRQWDPGRYFATVACPYSMPIGMCFGSETGTGSGVMTVADEVRCRMTVRQKPAQSIEAVN